MAEYEYFDLPEETLRDKEAVYHEIATDMWPNKRLITGLDWNNASEEWHFAVGLIDFGQIIPRSPAKLNLPYAFRDKLRFIFRDPSGRSDEITPVSLADRVRMTVWPGPASDAYEPRIVDNSLLSEEEEEPWRQWINYDSSTNMVKTPLEVEEVE